MEEEIDPGGPKFTELPPGPVGSSRGVHGPGSKDVELASDGIPEHPIELGSLVSALGARDALVFVDGDDFPASMPGDGSSSRRWFSVVCSPLDTRRLEGDAFCHDLL
jgi:hypothetical protein